MSRKKLPADFAMNALVAEAEKRRKKLGLPFYSYGNLVADTTEEERRKIVERYRRRKRNQDTEADEIFRDPDVAELF